MLAQYVLCNSERTVTGVTIFVPPNVLHRATDPQAASTHIMPIMTYRQAALGLNILLYYLIRGHDGALKYSEFQCFKLGKALSLSVFSCKSLIKLSEHPGLYLQINTKILISRQNTK